MAGVPVHDINPVFQTRHPLGKGFPGNPTISTGPRSKGNGGGGSIVNANTASSFAMSSSPLGSSPARPRSSAAASAREKSVQSEYIRNLQQQIYLLELETRYLKSGRAPAGPQSPMRNSSQIFGSRHALQASIGSLAGGLNGDGYEDPAETEIKKSRQEAEKLRGDSRKLEISYSAIEKERDELKQEINSLKDRHATEKDKIYGELISAKKKHETAASEAHRAELSYQRVVQEKEQLEAATVEARSSVGILKEKIDEQLEINSSLRARIEELMQKQSTTSAKLKTAEQAISSFRIDEHRERIDTLEQEQKRLNVQIKQMEQEAGQVAYQRKKADDDMREIIQLNVELSHQRDEAKRQLTKEREDNQEKKQHEEASLEEMTQQRHDLARLKDDYSMLKISADNKDRKIADLQQQIRNCEVAHNKSLEAKIVLTEKVSELENRLRSNEYELIQVGQDKSLLTDDVAELKNQLDTLTHKLATTTTTNTSLKVDLDKCKRDLKAMQSFATVLDQVESNGQNYLQLMRDMRKHLDVATEN